MAKMMTKLKKIIVQRVKKKQCGDDDKIWKNEKQIRWQWCPNSNQRSKMCPTKMNKVTMMEKLKEKKNVKKKK
jgi:hypothetical protein